MRRLVIFVTAVVLAALFWAGYSRAVNALRVDEAGSTVELKDGHAQVTLPVVNPVSRAVPVRVSLQLLDPQGEVRAQATQDAILRDNSTDTLRLALPFHWDEIKTEERYEFFWYRLRYEITPTDKEHAPASGVVSVSQLDAKIFEFEAFAPLAGKPGQALPVRVRAIHPATWQPVPGVQLQGGIAYDDEPPVNLQATAVTDADGYALLNFPSLPEAKDGYPQLTVTGRLGDFTQTGECNIQILTAPRVITNTDKPLYQPGQTVHARVLAFTPANRAWAGQKVILKVKGPGDEIVFRAEATTSRFGVVNFAWPIAANTKLGQYSLNFADSNDEDSRQLAYHSVRVSRYDLPNFAVNVKPDHPYYLPGQKAEIAVRGDYLFGQPVTRGRVRVVREEEREWNYKEQKYDIKEAEEYKGETDDKGVFTAHIDLKKFHQGLGDEQYNRYKDITYAAYFTDLTTNRTEQRRFDIRVTKEAIHLYWLRPDDEFPKTLPLEFYLTASYADGAPCAGCAIAIRETDDDGEPLDEGPRKPVRTVQANAYGVAKVADLKPSAALLDEYGPAFTFEARDAQGRKGHFTDDFDWEEDITLRLSASRTLYRTGEPFTVKILSTVAETDIYLDITADSRLLSSRKVRANGGRAEVTIPYSREFRNQVVVNAYAVQGEDSAKTSCSVFYPYNDELKLELKPDRDTHQPGQEANIDFRVRQPDGGPAESALGVVVFDRAVEERARTDSEFGRGRFGFYWSYEGGSIAGVTERGLSQLDWSQKLPDGLELAAEALLNGRRNYWLDTFDGEGHNWQISYVFQDLLKKMADPIKKHLDAKFWATKEYPRDEAALRRLLTPAVNLDELRDPWGQPFRLEFGTDKADDTLKFITAGPDKRFGNDDDMTAQTLAWPYFQPYTDLLDRAGREYHTRTGGYIRDLAIFKAEALRVGVSFDELRDRWGRPYRVEFGAENQNYLTKVISSGPNGVAQTVGAYQSDDFFVSHIRIDTFTEARAAIETALVKYIARVGGYPANAEQFMDAMTAGGVDFKGIHDPWGRRYEVTITETFRYADQTTVRTTPEGQTRTVTPVTQKYANITISSGGPDGKLDGKGDFNAATFIGLISEKSSQSEQKKKPNITLADNTGAISGRVVDPNGAVIPGVTVVATNTATNEVYSAASDGDGNYIIRNLPRGVYSLRFAASGFMVAIVEQVSVNSGQISEVMMMLQAGAVSQTVTITAETADVVNTSNATVATTITQLSIQDLPLNERSATGFALVLGGQRGRDSNLKLDEDNETTKPTGLSTPRLREYFPETLVWQPELVTDAEGRARLKFKFADNITTWKMSVIGSTADGRLGLAETELPAFQPFFADHDPPRILTEGDEIALPVVLRNYLKQKLDVTATMQPESWFSLSGAAEQRASVPAGDAKPVIFPFRAVSSVTDGKQRVTALSSEASDAIEKPVTVHPDGEERNQTAGDILGTAARLEIDVPQGVIPSSLRGEVKLYPNLSAHVGESLAGILRRPYGCGEQTISAAYPALLILRRDKQTGQTSPQHARAARYLREGYEKLLNFQAPGGGFTYWGSGEPDLALTANAVRFLSEAREFTPVDDKITAAAREWLIKKQRSDGAWPAYDYWPKQQENAARTLLQTAYIARVLAGHKAALDYVAARLDVVDEPHFIANYALAASNPAEVARALAKLRAMAQEEGAAAYWKLETNTPFYGWGTPGRIETTALVAQALAKGGAPEDKPLINRGLLFLLKNKDCYGVWYSTQATVNVLDALISQLPAAQTADSAAPVTILVNGQPAGEITMPDVKGVAAPLTLDVAQYLQPGRNIVELRRPAGASPASVNFAANYYVSWPNAAPPENVVGARALRLAVKYNKTQAKAGEEITCAVQAERVGFRGYGMMLAEIGLPPGADVDRASLEKAVTDSGWSLTRYDVLPDKIIVYLWPRAGGVNFSFKFKPRYGLNAQTAPSVLYDYYNPEARAVVAPARFAVR